MAKAEANRYARIIERIFLKHYTESTQSVEIPFAREEFVQAAEELGIVVPKNLGDLLYSFRYRSLLPPTVQAHAPIGQTWIILPAGRARYKFAATTLEKITPTPGLTETKIPDATPGLISLYALGDEQALLARLRYNRLIDIFTGVTCYSLQNHLRTALPTMGQIETDEIYVGVDRRGAHYVFPIQAKGGKDKLSVVQIFQDFELCKIKFPNLVCQPIAAQFNDG